MFSPGDAAEQACQDLSNSHFFNAVNARSTLSSVSQPSTNVDRYSHPPSNSSLEMKPSLSAAPPGTTPKEFKRERDGKRRQFKRALIEKAKMRACTTSASAVQARPCRRRSGGGAFLDTGFSNCSSPIAEAASSTCDS